MKKFGKKFSFADVPSVRYSRSQQDLSFTHSTTMDMGRLYPVFLKEVLPGDTWVDTTVSLTRLTTPLVRPIMADLYQDTYFFFVPGRLVFDQFKNVFGENDLSEWYQPDEPFVPTVGGAPVLDSVADHFGLPVLIASQDASNNPAVYEPLLHQVSVLPFRCLALIWNEYFRDENYEQPCLIQKGASVDSESLNGAEWSPTNYTGMCPRVNKFHDYFTSVVPEPQKGDPVSLSDSVGQNAQLVLGRPYTLGVVPGSNQAGISFSSSVPSSENRFGFIGNTGFSSGGAVVPVRYNMPTPTGNVVQTANISVPLPSSSTVALAGTPVVLPGPSEVFDDLDAATSYVQENFAQPEGDFSSGWDYLRGTNLYANLSASSFSVNDLRQALAVQRLLEKDAMFGTRYVEYLYGHFGVTASDKSLQRPQYLGGKRFPLNIQQVTQSDVGSSGALGQVAANSQTSESVRFVRSFEEHGYIVGVSCIRMRHSYMQGLQKLWRREKRTDFYDPVFSHIGYQPVYSWEMIGVSTSEDYNPDGVFGYREAWSEYRKSFNELTGFMRPSSAIYDSGLTLVQTVGDLWTAQNAYDWGKQQPVANADFLYEDSAGFARVLSGGSQIPAFAVDFYNKIKAYRVMPVYSTPGGLV